MSEMIIYKIHSFLTVKEFLIVRQLDKNNE